MDADLLNEILNCQNLPSLPAVAVKVLDMTADPDVKMPDLAAMIEKDQALSVKILRTVNSSFYGLRKRCASIDKALVLLGLGPVKTLVLGFSLVTCVGADGDDGFDYAGYWRRALETGVSAKAIARKLGFDCEDEAFVVGLLQDVGMVAMSRAMRERYHEVVRRAGEHEKLVRAEIDAFELQHADVGALLAESWHLPPELYVPVKFHEKPTACPTEHSHIARCVAFGNKIHAVLLAGEPTEALRQAYRRGEQWFGLSESVVDEIIGEAGEAARELGGLFDLDTSGMGDPEEILARADRRMIEMSRAHEIESYAAREFSGAGEAGLDAMTGLLDARGFADALRAAFPDASRGVIELAVVQIALSGLSRAADVYGESVQDEVVLGAGVMLLKHFEPLGGIVARIAPGAFGVVLPRTARRQANDAAQAVCEQFGVHVGRWAGEARGIGELVYANAGVATVDAASMGVLKTPELLIEATNRALSAARGAGAGAVRAFVPKPRAA